MRRGEIYRTRERIAERGAKPGFYVVVSRTFVAEHEDVSTVICAPVYGEVLGLTTEVVLGPEDGLPRTSAIRCDFLTLMFKSKLTHFVIYPLDVQTRTTQPCACSSSRNPAEIAEVIVEPLTLLFTESPYSPARETPAKVSVRSVSLPSS